MTLVWRPLTEADATEWVRLSQAVEAVDRTGENFGAEDFAELAASSRVDLPTGSVGVFDGDRMLACGQVWTHPSPTGTHRPQLEGQVHPDVRHTGLGRALLAELERLGKARHAAIAPETPLRFLVACHEANKVKADMLAAAGYAPDRWFFDMRCDLAATPPSVPLPSGVHLAPYPDDDEPVRLALNEFFAEHWAHQGVTPQTWLETTTGHAYRPDLSFLLRDDDGEIAALVISNFFPADHAQTGVRELWIADVGTRKSLRGKGLATALLAHTLGRARAEGFQRAALDVDSDNPTGALGVYRRCGFTVTDRWTFHGKQA